MKALSIRQPWAWAIVERGKDVENRSWTTNHRGPLLIHAPKTLDAVPKRILDILDAPDELPTSGIVAIVQLVDVVRDSCSSWASPGAFHWLLEGARAVEFVPCRGMPGLFDVDYPLASCGGTSLRAEPGRRLHPRASSVTDRR